MKGEFNDKYSRFLSHYDHLKELAKSTHDQLMESYNSKSWHEFESKAMEGYVSHYLLFKI